MYSGKFSILFLDDARTAKRLIYRVLDHAPTGEDILELLNSFKQIVTDRKLEVHGVTTDGSELYKATVPAVFPGAIHQLCEFHAKQAVTKAILKEIVQIRRKLERSKRERLKRGRPSGKAKKTARKNARLRKKIGDLFRNRFLFVRKRLTTSEEKTFKKTVRGFPELHRLRELVNRFYRLYDRRCCTKTALKKLRRLRRIAGRFRPRLQVLKSLNSPMIDKSLRFLDDKYCPSTSNSVERSNRGFRKMQKSIYRVRTLVQLRQRIALDMFRSRNSAEFRKTLSSLHHARAGKVRPP